MSPFTSTTKEDWNSDLCNEEVHPGQQVDEDQTEDKQIVDLWLDRTQESIHGSEGQELPGALGTVVGQTGDETQTAV